MLSSAIVQVWSLRIDDEINHRSASDFTPILNYRVEMILLSHGKENQKWTNAELD